MQGWLPCGVGPGDCFELVPTHNCEVDIGIVQEAHATREHALGARSTHVDLGMALLKIESDGQYTLVGHRRRVMDSQVCGGKAVALGPCRGCP